MEPVPLPFLQQNVLPLLFLVVVGSLAFPPSLARTATSLPLIGVLAWQFVILEEKDFFGNHYSIGVLIGLLSFSFLDRIVLASPDKEAWTKLTKDAESDAAEAKASTVSAPTGFLRRFWWSLCTFFNLRGVGWSYQIKNVPVALPADYPRWKFVIRKLLRAAYMFLLNDTLCPWTASMRYGSFRDIKGWTPVGFDSSSSYSEKILLSWVYIAITYTALEVMYCTFSALFVLFHLATPNEWPPLFGDLREMYTLRKAWSVTWHQSMRRVCSTGGLFAARHVFHLQKGTFASKYVQLFGGFLVSAAMHAFGAMAYHGELRTCGEFSFFMAQALAIMVEDHVIALGHSLGLRNHPVWRLLGFMWVVVWFGSNTAWFSNLLAEGIWNHQRGLDVFKLGPPLQ